MAETKMYLVIDSSPMFEHVPIKVTEYIFDEDNEQDSAAIEDYIDGGTFEDGCRRFLEDTEAMDWETKFCKTLVLNEKQFVYLQNF